MLQDKALQAFLTVIIALMALNWGFVEFLDYNLLTDGLTLTEGSTEYQALVGIGGVAAIIRSLSVFQWVSD